MRFNISSPYNLVSPLIARLGTTGLLNELKGMFRRMVSEEYSSHDLASAIEHNAATVFVAQGARAFRKGPFMGEKPVPSILAIPFARSFCEPIRLSELDAWAEAR